MFFRGNEKPGIHHAQGFEDFFAQELVEGLARNNLDEIAEDIGGHGVIPALAGRKLQGQGCDFLDRLLQVPGAVHALEPGLAVRRIHRGSVHEAVGEARCMGEQVLDSHRTCGALGDEIRITPDLENALLGKFGDEILDGIPELEEAALVEHHRRDRRDGLGHRVDAEDRVLFQGALALEFHVAEG